VLPRWLWLTVLCSVLVGGFFRAYHLDRKAFWEDEMLGTIHLLGYSEADIVRASPHLTHASDIQAYFRLPADRSHDGLTSTVAGLAAEDPQHPPLYYVLAHLWVDAFGTSLSAIRALPAIFGILALPCVFWLALELFRSRATALVALGLFALSPVFVLYSQEAREYSLWTIVVALASVAFLRALRSPSLLAWSAYALCLAVGLYIYPLTALVAAGHALYLLAATRLRLTPPFRSYLLAAAAAAAAFVPWLLTMLHSQGVARGMSNIENARLSLGTRAVTILRGLRAPVMDFGYKHNGGAVELIVLAFTLFTLALTAYALYALVTSQPFRVWGFVLVGLCLPLLPFFFYRGYVFQTRYFTPLLLGLILALAALFAAKLAPEETKRGSPGWTLAFAAVLGAQVASCYLSSQALTWWNKAAEHSSLAAAAVDGAASPLVTSTYFVPSMLSLGYYLNPNVPIRVALRCSQCNIDPPPAPQLPEATPGTSVFVLAPPDGAPPIGHSRLIDPRPFPPAHEDLTLFEPASS
jgi:uncharacterized membrane protein